MIQRVESFEPELHVENLRTTRDPNVLEQRKVPIGQAWTAPDVTSCVAQACGGARSCKTRELNIVGRIPGVDWIAATWQIQTIRVIIRDAAVQTQWIAGDGRREGQSGRQRQ